MATGKLSARACQTLGEGMHGDGSGLYLSVAAKGSRSWVYRFTQANKRREMGLGRFPDLSLKDARERRSELARLVHDGIDPIEQRAAHRLRQRAGGRTVAELTKSTFDGLAPSLRDGGKAGRWLSPVQTHILPALGGRDVETLTQLDIAATLTPIWKAKPDVARKALRRLRMVMRHAAAHGLEVDLNAPLLAKEILGQQNHRETHIAAMPWQEVPGFFAAIDGGSTVQLALRLLILTVGPRSRPVRYAHIDQFDLNAAIWTIPADGEGARMKGRQGKASDFRVPLTAPALEVVKAAVEQSHGGFLFPSVRGQIISDMGMSALMKRAGLKYRPHGFRSSFRDWAAEQGVAEVLAEMCLAHSVGSKVARAYRRTDQLDSRRDILNAWANFVTGAEKNESGSGQVIAPLDERRAGK